MKIRGIVIFVALFLLAVLPVGAGSSIGVSPPSQDFFMMPGESKSGQLRVIYAEPYPSVAKVFPTKDLADIITIENPEIELPAGGPAPPVRYRINIPDDQQGKFGYGGDIRIQLEPPSNQFRQGGGTGAFAAIASLISVRTPTPGKYLAAKFKPVSNINAGEIAYFTIEVMNLGTDYLDNVQGKIELYDAQENLVTIVQTTKQSLGSGQESELYAYWETVGMPPSYYTAKFVIDYGGDRPSSGDYTFLVGDLVVKVDDVRVNNTNREVTKFEIDVSSLWNAPIPNVYAELQVTNATGHKSGFAKSTLENLVAQGRNTLVAYLESGHLPAGKYDATITVLYESKTVEKIVPFEILGDRLREEPRLSAKISTFFSGTNILLLILILLLANLFIFLILSKKYEEKPKKPKPHAMSGAPVSKPNLKKVENMEMQPVMSSYPEQSSVPSQVFATPQATPMADTQVAPQATGAPLGGIQRVATVESTLKKLDELSKQ